MKLEKKILVQKCFKYLFGVMGIYFLSLISLSGNDTILFKILTSPVPIKHMVNVNGKIIVARYDGVFEFDGDNFKKSVLDSKDLKPSFRSNESWAKLADSKAVYAQVQLSAAGIYWVLIKNKFIYGFKILNHINRSYPQFSVRGIYSNGDSVFVATYSGFYLNGRQIFKDTLYYSNSNFWPDKNWIYFSANDEDNLYRVDKQFSKLELILPGEQKENVITYISAISLFNDYIYVGGNDGFGRYRKNSGFESLAKNMNVSNFQIINGNLWLACKEGVFLFQNEKLVLKIPVLSNGLFEVGNKILSTGNGLWEYNLSSGQITNILKGTMYENIETYEIFADGFGNYWVSSVDGILIYQTLNSHVSVILGGTEFNTRSYFFDNKRLFFGSSGFGLVELKVENLISDEITQFPSKKMADNTFLFVLSAFSVLLLITFLLSRRSVNKKDIKRLKNDHTVFFAGLESYIREHIDEINVDQIRYQSGLSKYAFYSKFYEYFGKKPKELISEIKQKNNH
jgi:hypothetical protein